MASVLILEKCPYCARHRSPQDIRKLSGGAKICTGCMERHEAAVLALSGLKANGDGSFTSTAPPPQECSECRITPAILRDIGRGKERWSIFYENGVYRVLCKVCGDSYEQKRKEFFVGTAYAKLKGLN